MLTPLLLCLCAPALQDPPPPAPPAAETPPLKPEEAAKAVEEALKGKNPAAATEALREHGLLTDKKVVKAVAGGLSHKDAEVRLEAIRALRYNPSPEALSELLKVHKSKPIVEEDEHAAAEYFLALGQHGDKRALPVLSDNLFTTAHTQKVVRARIMAVAHIRDKGSVDALMSMMTYGRGRAGNPYMQELRLGLMVLTGEDHGTDSVAWLNWWGDNKKTLKITEEEWPLPERLQGEWRRQWAPPQEKAELERKRKERDGAGGE